MENIIIQESSGTPEQTETRRGSGARPRKPDYAKSPAVLFNHITAFLLGFALGFVIAFVYYKILPLSIFGGALFGVVYIFISAQNLTKKRLRNLRTQFFDLLEALSVAMRAGNPPAIALQSAREDLTLLYPETSDIITELDIIIALFNNAVPLSDSFHDFAERSGIEDIESFASIYRTIEGKSGRADEIVRQTQAIISDKLEIEMEIETLMTSAKSEMKTMSMMPLIILLIMGYAGAGFMDSIYTTNIGRIVASFGLAIFAVSIVIGNKISNVKV
jgi:tight adherence protein B